MKRRAGPSPPPTGCRGPRTARPIRLAASRAARWWDEVLGAQQEALGIPHSPPASDAAFLRRATLDAIGLIPTPEAVRAFLADDSPDKRTRLVDELIGNDEFAEQWAWFFGDLFRLAHQVGPVRNPFQSWIKEWLTTDRPYDEVVRDLLTGVAKAHGSVPSLAFLARSHQAKSRIVMGPDDYSIHNRLDAIDQFNVDVSRIFLGVNTSCISCHDGAAHLEPLNEWLSKRTREEFFRHSAFMGNARQITTWDDRSKNVVVDLLVDDLAKGYDTGNDAPYHTLSEGRFPRLAGLAYEPAFLLTGETPRPGENPRDELARMLTEHPQFARATVNLVWGKLMTVAFVEPLQRLRPRPDGAACRRRGGLPALATPEPRTHGSVGRRLPKQRFQLLAPGQDDHEVGNLRPVAPLRRGVGRGLDRLLPSPLCPGADRPGTHRLARARHRRPPRSSRSPERPSSASRNSPRLPISADGAGAARAPKWTLSCRASSRATG